VKGVVEKGRQVGDKRDYIFRLALNQVDNLRSVLLPSVCTFRPNGGVLGVPVLLVLLSHSPARAERSHYVVGLWGGSFGLPAIPESL
jgi:hypothetical protein